MRCPECDYSLWDLKAGPCPECGRPFKPSEFEFLANAVRFCCPHCDQAYYGTSERGQLVPERFDCVSCGRPITTDEMRLKPAEALGHRDAHLGTNPWLNTQRGLFKRWFLAVVSGIGQPGRMIEVSPAFGSTGPAVALAILNILVASLTTMGLFLLPALGSSRMMVGMMGFMSVIFVVAPLVFLFVWVAATHGLLRLLRAGPADGIGRTMQAIGFSSGGYMMALVPCVGPPMGFVAWCVTATIAVKAGQCVSSWKATIATLALPAAVVVSLVVWYVWFMVSAFSAAQHYSQQPHNQPPGWGQPVAQPNLATGTDIRMGTQRVAEVLRARVQTYRAPAHVAYLADDPTFDPMAFSEQGGAAAPRVGPSDLWQLALMDEPSRRAVLNPIVAAWPPDTTAHRVGRILLTYHGITPYASPDLWIMVQLPAEPGEDFWAITMAGYERVDRSNPQPALDAQNNKRMAAGLPPLPDWLVILGGPGPWSAADAPDP